MLDHTTLAAIIRTSKVVTDRLGFIDDLDQMLFDHKSRLRERRELHRILSNGHAWVFGDEYSLAVSDKGLTKVLDAHLKLIRDATPIAEPVRDAEGHTRIVDLMLSKVNANRDCRHHLVVELKAPSVRLTMKEFEQIMEYANAVSANERFNSPKVTWDFWLVGNDTNAIVHKMANSNDRLPGVCHIGDNYRVFVRRWAELLEENRQRHHFYREHMDYQPGDDSDLEAMFAKYLAVADESTVEPPGASDGGDGA
jgi:hypothetical protein